MDFSKLRVMVIGAHPDDADTFAGGTAFEMSRYGRQLSEREIKELFR